MFSRPSLARACVLALGLAATASSAEGPCDIYAAGNTPCVAAHSTTRALYSAYTGPLYQVKRGSDSRTTTIAPLAAGGVANASAQDAFCASTTCLISIIYDQSGSGNHLTAAPPGSAGSGPGASGYDNLASAAGAPVTLGGQRAYGVFIAPGSGYRNNAANGTAHGDAAEGIYAVLDGTHYNGGCCFDYGNAEANSKDTGAGHMECIYFGNCNVWGTGAGKGPWIMGDLENGLFSGQGSKNNAGDLSISDRFITAVVKGKSNNGWAIRGGNAVSGALSTFYNGQRPSGYSPMKKEGAIILGIGGDNSHGAQGTFYEGAMTSGYPSDATEDAIQTNIIAAQYAVGSSGPALASIGASISLQATSSCCTTQYLAHTGSTVNTQIVSSSSTTALKQQASWTLRTGLGNSACFSLESVDTPGSYIRRSDAGPELQLNPDDGSKQFAEDATFCSQAGLNGLGYSIRSWNYPTRYVRHYNNMTYAAGNGGVNTFDDAEEFHDDVSWVVTGFA